MKAPRNAAARHACQFAECLTLVGDHSGQPLKLLPFQRQILSTIFGNLDAAGRRRVKRVFLMLPRKQAKTTLVAAIVLYWLLGLGKRGVQALSVANDRAQAAIIYDTCRQMIEADDELAELCTVSKSSKNISIDGQNSFYQSLSTESTTKTGWSPSLVILDEAQDIADPDLVKNLTTGFGARDDYLLIFIGTAGTRKDTAFYAEYEYAKQVISGVIDNPTYAAFIYEAGEDADWTDERVWHAAMPALGKFCSLQFIRDEFEQAKRLPHKEAAFRQYYLNQWQLGSAAKWIPDATWMLNNSKPLGDAPHYYGGLDMASVSDTSSFVLYGRNSAGLWDVIPRIWVCEEQIERRQTAEFDYKRWEQQKLLSVTPGSAQDQEFIAADILKLAEQYKIKEIACDPYGMQWMAQRLMSAGLVVKSHGQGASEINPALR
ncbi:MAG TPA: terminase large subunit, partial [Pirellulales bacterium]|nr:terminase large subunit [Pirellulales bacterium]